ncbi:MAG: hypothetical protein J0L55_13540 [Caulobacterales bacterium]|nr:hypothetical protein [Caulobacterales bacterium]
MNKPFEKYEIYQIIWQNIQIEIRYCDYVAKVDEKTTIIHLEIMSFTREPLPITETGYKSYFTAKCLIEEFGGPVEYAKMWLDGEAKDNITWQNHVSKSRQLSLF